MLNNQDIINFFKQFNYDLRVSGNGRWIDQKCAADVLTIVSDCIIHFVEQDITKSFSSADIWHAQYTVDNVAAIFKKPSVEDNSAKSEYNKFFMQPLELLSYAGVLKKAKKNNTNIYNVQDLDVLNYIAMRERNALFFLYTYIEKVLKDSNYFQHVENFLAKQDQASYCQLKNAFAQFIIENTKINGTVECNRIFIKVLNPIAYHYDTLGTEKGRLSKRKITFDQLMYNRLNFRDLLANKPKDMTRKDYLSQHNPQINERYLQYQVKKAKNFLREFNNTYRRGLSEHIEDRHMLDKAVQMHHIFPESLFPEISNCLENLIALTPTQHLGYAHPNNNTSDIDEHYQHSLLLSKAERIKENLTDSTVDSIYSFANLLFILSVGLNDLKLLDIADMDFDAVVKAINMHYDQNSSSLETIPERE